MQPSDLMIRQNKNNLSYEICYHGFSWVSDGRSPYVILGKTAGGKTLRTYRPLKSAKKKTFEQTDRKIVARLSGFTAFGKRYGFTLILTAQITGANTVDFSLQTENEQEGEICAVYFPAPFSSAKRGRVSYHVDSMRQGFLLPDGYRKNFLSTFAYANYPRKINTGDCYLPLWGRVCDRHTFSAIVRTPDDACMFSSFGRRGAFVQSVHWLSSLGTMAYERSLRFTFHEDGDYNTVALDYRAYLDRTAPPLTMRQKIEKNPNIEKLVGSPVLHHKIYSKINQQSKFYDPHGVNEILYATFDDRARQLEKIKSLGLEKLYIHTDGWGRNGYDNDHPYILPPCEAAGGWDGLRRLAQTCQRLGYVFALHDQYRDFYESSPVFDRSLAVMNRDGSHPYCSIWDGGAHTFLCTRFAQEFIRRTYDELAKQKIPVQAVYLDVFSILNGDECFHPAHRLTRGESMDERGKCFDLLDQRGLILSSEEPAARLLDHLALVHHGPFAVRPQEGGKAVGIPVPLTSLVFHDCILIPWTTGSGWGIPTGDNGDLYCALCAGMPYFFPFGTDTKKIGRDRRPTDGALLEDQELRREIARVTPLMELQARLFDQKMLRHEFLGNLRRQRAIYEDGTAITIDLDAGSYEIHFPEKG